MQHQRPTGKLSIYVRTAAAQESPTTRHHHHMTTDDLTALAIQIGWLAEQITVNEEHGVSGSAAEDARPGLKTLLDTVRQGSVQAILVSDEYRLFRGARKVAVDVFIHLCQERHVTVITPLTVYDFSNPMCVRAFRFLCEHESATRYVQTAGRGKPALFSSCILYTFV